MPDLLADKAFYAPRVFRGSLLLDSVRPGWWREIASDRLAMTDCTRCVLGQLYGGYWEGFRRIVQPLDSRLLFSSAEFGFTLRDDEQAFYDQAEHDAVLVRFAALAEAWRDAIRRRKEIDPHAH